MGERLGHGLLAALAGELDEPADGQRAGTPGRNLDRDLVGGATDAARADLEHRRQGFDPGLELLHRALAGALSEDRQGVVDDLLGHRLPCRWSASRGPPCAAPSSASSAWSYTRACTPRDAAAPRPSSCGPCRTSGPEWRASSWAAYGPCGSTGW